MKTFLFSWCCDGFECIRDITKFESFEEDNFALLLQGKEEKTDELGRFIHMLQLRARFNPQRNYEIYAIKTSPDFTEEYFNTMADDDPQMLVDLIRDRGVELYSDRKTSRSKIL